MGVTNFILTKSGSVLTFLFMRGGVSSAGFVSGGFFCVRVLVFEKVFFLADHLTRHAVTKAILPVVLLSCGPSRASRCDKSDPSGGGVLKAPPVWWKGLIVAVSSFLLLCGSKLLMHHPPRLTMTVEKVGDCLRSDREKTACQCWSNRAPQSKSNEHKCSPHRD